MAGKVILPDIDASEAEPRSRRFRRSLAEGLVRLHGDLLAVMREGELVGENENESRGVVRLVPSLGQQQASLALLEGYRRWFDRVRPFLDRDPAAPLGAFDEAFGVLSSFFALRRVATDVSDAVWREMFELESSQLVGYQLTLLEEARECFSLLDPRSRRQFEDLVVKFTPTGDRRFEVLAESSVGEAAGEMIIPFDARDVENFVLRNCDPLRGGVRGWTPRSMQPFADFGGALFDALFAGSVRDLYMAHVAASGSGVVGLRLRLRFGASPWLATLPWEYLYDGTDFIALTGAVSLTRQVDAPCPMRPLRVDGPLRIAVTVSAPSDHAAIDSEAEVKALRATLAPLVSADLVRLDVAPDGTLSTLARMVRAAEVAGSPFHVWHFIGHGRYLEEEGGTYLNFESANGTSQTHSGFELATLFCAHPALRLAVLNSCEGARAAPEDSLTSVGAALVARGVPAAVAMQFSISDGAAIRFADDFYRALADDGSIDTAVNDARRAVFFAPNESEWATPVILTRMKEGVIFER
jgi:CHAT domain-containing protein